MSSITPTLTFTPADPALAASLGLDRFYTIEVPDESDVQTFAEQLRALPELVETAQTDGFGGILGVIPNDTLFPLQYGLRNPLRAGADIHAAEAWETTTGSSAVKIAIIDTGVSHSHPELASKLLPGRNFADGDPENSDDSTYVSHGTSVAGIAAALGNNDSGIAGVSWEAMIIPVRVTNQYGTGTETQCANGIVWATDAGANIINASLGFSQGSEFFAAAVRYAYERGVFLCAAAGNTPTHPIGYPARFPNVVAVGATDALDLVAGFSASGPELEICAPGVDIFSTMDTTLIPNGYDYITGTSASSPFVAGTAALLLSVAPNLTNDQIHDILLFSANDIGAPGWDATSGWGRLNAARALYVVDPTPACPGDWNRDGRFSSQDLFDFINDYLSVRADINGDGQTNSDDLFIFLVRFFDGC